MNFKKTKIVQLRFITDLKQETAFNMAADQYLLHKCTDQDVLYIRFYSWKFPTITIGYMQNASDTLLFDKLGESSVKWIRRPTGGRAVLHWGDLTYSCIFPKTMSIMGASVKESYAVITRCLIDGLSNVGVKCSRHDSYDQLLSVKREIKLPCFLAPNRDEIMVNGRKLIGSAQKRIHGSVLQHGSLPISADFSKLPEFLNIDAESQKLQRQLLFTKSIHLHEINPHITIDMLIKSLKQGFINSLEMESVDLSWTTEELSDIKSLAFSEKFIKSWVS